METALAVSPFGAVRDAVFTVLPSSLSSRRENFVSATAPDRCIVRHSSPVPPDAAALARTGTGQRFSARQSANRMPKNLFFNVNTLPLKMNYGEATVQ